MGRERDSRERRTRRERVSVDRKTNNMGDEDFTSGGDVGEKTYPIRAGEVKKGMIVLLKGFPCKVVEVTTSKTGKHGHAKANITGLDIFTNKKYQDISPTSHNMTAPFVTVDKQSLIDINDDGFCTVMNEAGDTREDLQLPSGEVGDKIKEAFDSGDEILVTITKAMDSETITGHASTAAE